MKKLDKVILAFFSVLIFLQAILVICMLLGWIKVSTVGTFVEMALTQKRTSTIIMVLEIVCLISSFKCIFFDDSESEKKPQGVLMQNDNGKLLISKSTIESIVNSVINGFDSVEDVTTIINFDNLNNLIIDVNIVVTKDVIIKEITLNIQNKIKEAIKRTSDLEIKEINVKIKDIITETDDKTNE